MGREININKIGWKQPAVTPTVADPTLVISTAPDQPQNLSEQVACNAPVLITSLVFHTILILLLTLWLIRDAGPNGVFLTAGEGTQSQELDLNINITAFDVSLSVDSQLSELVDDTAMPESLSDEMSTEMQFNSFQAPSLIGSEAFANIAGAGFDRSAGQSSGDGSGEGSQFFGMGGGGKRFVFVIDASGSMYINNRWNLAISELIKAIRNLGEDQEFCVILFNHKAHPMLNWKKSEVKLLAATPENISKLVNWVMSQRPSGDTWPKTSLQYAIDLNPDAIYLLSDGVIQDDSLDFLRRYNNARRGGSGSDGANFRKIPIHTIALDLTYGQELLQLIAIENGGTFVKKSSR